MPPAAFYTEKHRVIWRAIQDLETEGVPPGVDIVANRLEAKDELERIGHRLYLDGLAEGVNIATYATHYANIVLEAHKQREIIRIMNTTVQGAYDKKESTQLLAEHELALTSLTRFDSIERGPADYEQEAIDLAAGVGGLSTGLLDLDGVTGGLVKGGYNVIAARPSMGKVLCCVASCNTALTRVTAWHFSVLTRVAGKFTRLQQQVKHNLVWMTSVLTGTAGVKHLTLISGSLKRQCSVSVSSGKGGW